MDQQKTGKFLKCLRKGKGLTQEQLAEHFCVSSRTISRWENGNNMPDVDILMELADFYEVDLRELIDGERKSETQDKETKETVFKAAEYMNAGTEPFPQKRTQKSVKKRNKNTEISRAAIRRRKRQIRPQSVQAKAIQGQNGGGWCCRKLRDRQTHRSVQQPGLGSA